MWTQKLLYLLGYLQPQERVKPSWEDGEVMIPGGSYVADKRPMESLHIVLQVKRYYSCCVAWGLQKMLLCRVGIAWLLLHVGWSCQATHFVMLQEM